MSSDTFASHRYKCRAQHNENCGLLHAALTCSSTQPNKHCALPYLVLLHSTPPNESCRLPAIRLVHSPQPNGRCTLPHVFHPWVHFLMQSHVAPQPTRVQHPCSMKVITCAVGSRPRWCCTPHPEKLHPAAQPVCVQHPDEIKRRASSHPTRV